MQDFSLAHFAVTIKRFGLPIFFLPVLTVFIVFMINASLDSGSLLLQRIAQSLLTSSLGLIGLQTLFETKGWSRSAYYRSSLALVLVIGALHCSNAPTLASFIWLLLGLFAFLFTASFLLGEGEQVKNDVIFIYLYRLSIAGFFAGFTTAVAFLGCVSLQTLITYLFDFPFSGTLTATILTLLAGLLFPCLALASVPLKIKALNTLSLPVRVLYVFDCVLIPLVFIYAGIIYAYAFKIGLEGVTPKGVLAYFTLGFAVVGIMAHWYVSSITFPKGFLSCYKKAFYWIFLLPLGLLIWSIFLRTSQHGLTPARYAVVLMAAWLACMTLYNLWYHDQNIRFSLLLFVISSLGSSFGPLSINNMTLMSQKTRLMGLLEKYELVEQGKMIKATKDLPMKDTQSITSCFFAIHSVGHLGGLVSLLPEEHLQGISYRGLRNLLVSKGINAR